VCTICKIRSSGWCEARVPLQLPRHEVPHVGYELEVFETTECSFSLVQPEERTRGGSLIADLFEPCTCIGFVVLSLDSSASAEPCLKEGRPVGLAKMKCREAVSTECWLQAGRTYLVVPLNLNGGAAVKATCACVSNRPVVMQRRNLSSSVVRAAWAAYAKSCPSADQREVGGAVLYQQKAEGGSCVIYAENRSRGYFNVDSSFSGHGLRCSRGWTLTNDWISPGHGQILQVVVPDAESDGSIGWRTEQRFQMTPFPPAAASHSPELPHADRGSRSSDRSAVSLHIPFRLS